MSIEAASEPGREANSPQRCIEGRRGGDKKDDDEGTLAVEEGLLLLGNVVVLGAPSLSRVRTSEKVGREAEEDIIGEEGQLLPRVLAFNTDTQTNSVDEVI